MKNALAEVWKHRSVLASLVTTDLKQRYSDLVGGLFWSVVHPLVLIFIYTFVFSVVLKVRIGGTSSHLGYGIFLFSGMLPWIVIQESVSRATGVFFEQRDVLRHVNLPNYVMPIFPVLSGFLHHLFALLVFLIIISFFGHAVSGLLALLIPSFVALLLFAGALAMLVAGFSVYWRDTGPFAQALLWIIFFATPIVYPIEIVPVRWRWALEINPLTQLVGLYRSALVGLDPPSLIRMVYLFAWVVLALALAGWVFSRLSRDLADYL